jgi:putative Holliday junction resolvase
VSDPTGSLATPIEPVARANTRRGIGRVRELIGQLGAERVIVGLPLSLSGEDSEQTREAREFATRLGQAVAIPVELYDERFTTVIAQREGGRASEDSRAAAVLLEDWLAVHQQVVAGDG